MNLTPIKANMTELRILRNNEVVRILFSYQTPVALQSQSLGLMKTSQKWSRTTSKHITQWINEMHGGMVPREMGQEYFDTFMNDLKVGGK